jgi:Cu/Ag efflux protein CusF
MAITDYKVSEAYTERDISSLSDRPNEQDGLSAAQLKAKFDNLNKELIPKYNDLIDELNGTVLPAKSNVGHTHTASEVTDFDTEVSNNTDVAANTSARHTHSNKTTLDNVTAAYTTAEQTKLSGIEAGAEVNNINDTQAAELTGGATTAQHYHNADRARSNHTGTQSADTITDGATNKVYTATEQTKLAGIEAGAEVNNINDTQATDLTDGGDSSLHYHAADRNRSNHSGTQSADTITDGTTNKAYTATEKTKLAGIESGAEVNNISDINATDLTDGGNSSLHYHSADRYTLPTAAAGTLGGVKVGSRLSIDGSGILSSDLQTFKDLTDTPAAYTGSGGYAVKVKADETGLEYVQGGAGVEDFTDLNDVPAAYTGQAGMYVRVNQAETALEFDEGGAQTNLTLTTLTLGNYKINFNSGTNKLEFLYIGA